jgi:predicted nucleic acid-binding protein
MILYVFDTSGIVRVFERAAVGARVEALLDEARHGRCQALVSAVNWGEVTYTLTGLFGSQDAEGMQKSLLSAGLVVIPATAARAERAATIKRRFRIAYADCFGVELAFDSPDHILVTADFGVKPADNNIRIEFLPVKTVP